MTNPKEVPARWQKLSRDAFYAGWKAASRFTFPADCPEFRQSEYEQWCDAAQIEPWTQG